MTLELPGFKSPHQRNSFSRRENGGGGEEEEEEMHFTINSSS